MEVKINREIRNYTESMFFGLSLRQFVFSLLAVGVAVLLYFVLKPYVGTETVSWMCILGAAPFAAMGFVNYNGMTAEQFVWAWLRSEIHHTISPKLGERCRTDKSIYYTLDFNVTPHLLRHTYITNLIHEGVDPKTVQYLAGHENSKVTMDIYAKVKYNKPWELAAVVNEAFQPSTEYRENPAS